MPTISRRNLLKTGTVTGISAETRFLDTIAATILGRTDPDALTQGAGRYPRQIVPFIEETMGFHMWPIQRQIAQSVDDNPATAVRSCHAAGKSAGSARIVPAFLHTRDHSIAVTTAPTNRQVQHILWRYINSAIRRSPNVLLGRPLQTRYEIADDWYGIGFKGDDHNADAFQGFHAEHILVVADEAAGVAESVFEGMEAILTGTGARQLLIGNPTSTSGSFRAAFHEASASYNTIRISAYDTPNFTTFGIDREDMLTGDWERKVDGRPMPYPALIDPGWVARQMNRHGPDSAFVKSRVDAEFPEDDGSTLIPLSQIDTADDLGGLLYERGQDWYLGIDAARTGDDETSVVLRQGMEVGPQESWHGLDTMQSVGRIRELVEETWALKPEQFEEVRVDIVGIGAGIGDRLRELGYPVRDVNVGAEPSDRDKWANLRHELWWQLRNRFRDGRIAPMEAGRFPGYDGHLDELAKAQLSDVKYTYKSDWTMPYIERKQDAKKRGVKSPDRAEAILLAFGNYPNGTGAPPAVIDMARAAGNW